MADTDRPDLDALQKLADEAAPGPWTATHSDMCCNEIESPDLDDDGQEIRIATAWAPPHLPETYDFEENNAAFIAAARSAVPALISYARSLEFQLAESQQENRDVNHISDIVTIPRQALQVAIANKVHSCSDFCIDSSICHLRMLALAEAQRDVQRLEQSK